MPTSRSIQALGTIVMKPGTSHLFINSPEHQFAVGNVEKLQIRIGDEAEFVGIVGDQFATVAAVNGRGLP